MTLLTIHDTIYASPIFLHVKTSVKNATTTKKNRKKSAIEKRSNVLIRVDKGWIGLNPIPRVQKRVESGWLLRGANRGESGWPSGSKFGLGAGRAGRVHLAALVVPLFFKRLFKSIHVKILQKGRKCVRVNWLVM